LSVSTDGSGEGRQSQPTLPESGYVNQVEAFLLPQLLLHAKAAPGEYGFYAYQNTSGSGAVSLRRDVVTEGDQNSRTITTRLTEDAEPQIAQYSAAGSLIRTTLANGNVWTPTTLQDLVTIWSAKHLPMDDKPQTRREVPSGTRR
jgi:hypothetical protein